MIKKVSCIAFICFLFSSVWGVRISEGFLYKNEEKKLYIKGKLVSDVIIRTEESADTTQVPIEKWDPVQQRNTLMVEVNHELGTYFNDLQVAYYLAPRIFYDSNWDIGPSVFSDDDTRRQYNLNNRDDIDDERLRAELFLAYMDFRKGPLFVRLGKQAFQWGEMSTIRVLDACIPQDNQSLAVDLEEKLVPLKLARATYSLEDVGFFDSILFEGYYIPRSIDDEYKEEVLAGSAIVPPVGRSGPYNPLAPVTPKDFHDPKDDRYGIRVGFKMGELDVYLAHFRKYSDSEVNVGNVDLTSPTFFRVDQYVPSVDVTGGSFSYYIEYFDGVIRGEAALFQDEPLVVDGAYGHQLHSGEASFFDVWKWGLAIDKYKMIRWLNPTYEIFFCLEWVGTRIKDYDSDIVYPWLDPDTGEKLYYDKTQNIFLAVMSTTYGSGRLDATLSFIYDNNSHTLLYIPKAKFMLSKSLFGEVSFRGAISNNYDGYGFLQDNDEVTFKLYYYF